MTRRKCDDPQARAAARLEIIREVNRFKLWHSQRAWWLPVQSSLFEMRHIQRAVHIARRHRLVKPDVLVAAGFNPPRAAT